jgi:hypothetical protein
MACEASRPSGKDSRPRCCPSSPPEVPDIPNDVRGLRFATTVAGLVLVIAVTTAAACGDEARLTRDEYVQRFRTATHAFTASRAHWHDIWCHRTVSPARRRQETRSYVRASTRYRSRLAALRPPSFLERPHRDFLRFLDRDGGRLWDLEFIRAGVSLHELGIESIAFGWTSYRRPPPLRGC